MKAFMDAVLAGDVSGGGAFTQLVADVFGSALRFSRSGPGGANFGLSAEKAAVPSAANSAGPYLPAGLTAVLNSAGGLGGVFESKPGTSDLAHQWPE